MPEVCLSLNPCICIMFPILIMILSSNCNIRGHLTSHILLRWMKFWHPAKGIKSYENSFIKHTHSDSLLSWTPNNFIHPFKMIHSNIFLVSCRILKTFTGKKYILLQKTMQIFFYYYYFQKIPYHLNLMSVSFFPPTNKTVIFILLFSFLVRSSLQFYSGKNILNAIVRLILSVLPNKVV